MVAGVVEPLAAELTPNQFRDNGNDCGDNGIILLVSVANRKVSLLVLHIV